MTDEKSPIIGIDLGTTNSVAAYVVDGRPQVIEEDGEALLPSIVGLNPLNQLITGVPARNQLAAFPDRTVASIKRKMGTMDPVPLAGQNYTPPEISAIILRRLRERASRALGRSVDRAVITVPAFFDENQRQATREAGLLAGLTVERIINEPTAATLVYHAATQDPKRIAVYDFGGGTFDVSIVRLEAGVVEVLTSRGDVHLGGDDLDQLLVKHVASQFQREHGIDLTANPGTHFRLLQACEMAKRHLSTYATAEIVEEFIAEKEGTALHLNIQVTRYEFEQMIAPMIERTINKLDEAIRDAQLSIHQLDDLVLVGGSTRIPLVAQRLREEFLREPSRAVDPDLAVALGAAVQAAMIEGESVGPVLIDVSSHTLGIATLDRADLIAREFVTSPLIRRNTTLPARFEQAYMTIFENQKQVEIRVLQGEYRECERNREIGKFMLKLSTDVQEARKLVVRFDLSLDGTLTVTATQCSTGLREELKINNALSTFQNLDRARAEERLATLFEAAEPLSHVTPLRDSSLAETEELSSEEDEMLAAVREQFPALVSLLEKAQNIVPEVNAEDAAEINRLCERIQLALKHCDKNAVETLATELDDILFYVR